MLIYMLFLDLDYQHNCVWWIIYAPIERTTDRIEIENASKVSKSMKCATYIAYIYTGDR